MTLDPQAEFDAPAPSAQEQQQNVTPAPAGPPAASAADLAALKGELQGKLAEIAELKSKTAIMDRLAEVFNPGRGGDPKDEWAKSEIRRLVPELDDVQRIKEILPGVLEALGAQYEEKVAEKAGTAVDHLKGLMKDSGLDVNDDDTVSYMEEALTRAIKADPQLAAMWARGQVRAAVGKAYDKVQSKIIAPIRAKTKAAAVRTIQESPRAITRGPAPSPAPAGQSRNVDVRDTSRAGVTKIHDAAFDRLQELMDRE